MQVAVRRKLEMAARVRDFSRAHPSKNAGYDSVLARLEERLGRADALATQQRAGLIAVHAATVRRQELRRALQFKLLRHLIRVGEAAAKERPELAERFRLPTIRATHKSFMVAVKAMLAEAVAAKDLFVGQGLSETPLDDLARMVTQFEEATETGNIGRRSHVGARADLAAVTGEVMDMVEWLDGLNRYRFRDDPELQAAWDSARNFTSRFKARVALSRRKVRSSRRQAVSPPPHEPGQGSRSPGTPGGASGRRDLWVKSLAMATYSTSAIP